MPTGGRTGDSAVSRSARADTYHAVCSVHAQRRSRRLQTSAASTSASATSRTLQQLRRRLGTALRENSVWLCHRIEPEHRCPTCHRTPLDACGVEHCCQLRITHRARGGDRGSALGEFRPNLTFRAESAVTWLARANGDDCLRDLCTAAQLHLAGPPGTLTSEPTSSGVELGGPIAPKSCALATRGTLKNVESMARTRERRWPAPRFWRGTLKYIPAGRLPKNLGDNHLWGRARQPGHQIVSPGPRFDTVGAESLPVFHRTLDVHVYISVYSHLPSSRRHGSRLPLQYR